MGEEGELEEEEERREERGNRKREAVAASKAAKKKGFTISLWILLLRRSPPFRLVILKFLDAAKRYIAASFIALRIAIEAF